MADQLIKVAAKREIASAESVLAPEGLFAEFCARFGHPETDDQLDAYIDLKMEDVIRLEHPPHPVEFDIYYSY